MNQMLKKLLCGDRLTIRLADEKGNLISFSRLIRNGPKAICSSLGRKFFNVRPEVPWISYDARRVIGRVITKCSDVLEFGSGNSTIWYAQRSRSVYSVEHNSEWYGHVSQKLRKRGLTNVHYYLHDEKSYSKFEESGGRKYDLVMIDGILRSACAETALRSVKSDGIVYLDNSDKHPHGGDTRGAEEKLVHAAGEYDGRLLYFSDFAPTDLFGNQGLMLVLGKRRLTV